MPEVKRQTDERFVIQHVFTITYNKQEIKDLISKDAHAKAIGELVKAEEYRSEMILHSETLATLTDCVDVVIVANVVIQQTKKGAKEPCLDPDKMHGACDGFGGSDF